jgi:hypothetical protein
MIPDPRIRVTCSWLIPDQTRADKLAAAYAAVFTSDEGKRVLDDLTMKFGPQKRRFPEGMPACANRAAVIDGGAAVMLEIYAFIQLGRAFCKPTDTQPNPNQPETDTNPCSPSNSTPPEATSSPDTTLTPAKTTRAKPSSPTKFAKSSSRKKDKTTE